MITKFNPTTSEKGSGLTAFVRWDSYQFIEAMSNLFGIRENERITSIEVTPEGITARIQYFYSLATDRYLSPSGEVE